MTMSEDTEMMFPAIAFRFLSEGGFPPDLCDPNGDPMGIGDVASLLLPAFQELCVGMGVGMDVTMGLIAGDDWLALTESFNEDKEAFQHPDNDTPTKRGVEAVTSGDGERAIVNPVADLRDESEVNRLVDAFMEKEGNALVEAAMGSEDPEAVRGPQIGSIEEDTGSSDDSEVCGCEYHPRSTYECPSCWRKRNAEWDAENPEWGEDE